MNLLVTGASGFVGAALVGKLDPIMVKALGRDLPDNFPESKFYQQDINSTNCYSEALSNVDIIVHLAARVHAMHEVEANPIELYREVNSRGTNNLARQAAKAGVKRFVFVSSIKVNGEGTKPNVPFTSADDRAPQDDYGLSKAEAEKELYAIGDETGMEVVIIRPTLVYGPGVKANFASLMNFVSKGIPLPFGCIKDNRRSLVSVMNLVDLIVTCIDHPKAANQTFLVSDDNDVSTSEMVAQMAKALGKPQWQLPIPKWCYRLTGKLLGKQDVVDRLLGALQVDITHTKQTLNWTPPQSLEDGFRETAQAFLQSKKK
ncbi:SDR family oxidoreductase [Vibrio sp. IB15]|uniref:UDP-glucose 4-epimerase family protein n=1 Tax=Vibrio sp. IB15 TaxID=2779368 RepID=UPI0018E815DA|nr:SDR family oxidoreductase [Vibrio sp. IB15]MBJ2145467.1 SDR family oxidoreductase [Vibrio sp. IB15]